MLLSPIGSSRLRSLQPALTYCRLARMASQSSQTIKINPLPRSLCPAPSLYQPSDFRRQDESSDIAWYAQPRFVQHIDDGAIAALKSYYGSVITPTDCVLDICSSWVSHLPESVKLDSMTGYGMNQQELERNAHLTKFFVRDLNADSSLREVPDESTDVVICTVSVDYLTKPVSVFKEMHRLLKAGGTAHISFSNRCFPTKVIEKWMRMNDEERRRWVGGYFWASADWKEVEEVVIKDGGGSFSRGYEDPLFVVRGRK